MEGEREGKVRGEKKGKDPQGLVDTPHVPNPEKYPEIVTSAIGKVERRLQALVPL